LTIYPDGGVKRVRIVGRRAVAAAATTSSSSSETFIPVLPLTPEAFEPFGKVIEAYADRNAASRGTKITQANQGTAVKFHKLALVESSYPEDLGATTGLSVYRCEAVKDVGRTLEVKVLERHPYTNQAFIPMGSGGGEAVYVVVVAKSEDGVDRKPDLTTLRAFVANSGQGVMYNTAVWRECFFFRRVESLLTG
jgi:allantoicase